jgi:hypothetical protein
MIEFKGTYLHEPRSESYAVLVQFDGVLLHIWHPADPFYRLLSSDVFHLGYSRFKRVHRIKLPNGAHIETDDNAAMTMLRKRHHHVKHRLQNHSMWIFGSVAVLLTLVALTGGWLIK